MLLEMSVRVPIWHVRVSLPPQWRGNARYDCICSGTSISLGGNGLRAGRYECVFDENESVSEGTTLVMIGTTTFCRERLRFRRNDSRDHRNEHVFVGNH